MYYNIYIIHGRSSQRRPSIQSSYIRAFIIWRCARVRFPSLIKTKRGQSLKKNYIPTIKFYCFWFYCAPATPGDLRRGTPQGIYFGLFFFLSLLPKGGGARCRRAGTLLFVYLFISMCPIFIVTTVTRFPSVYHNKYNDKNEIMKNTAAYSHSLKDILLLCHHLHYRRIINNAHLF